MKSRLMKEFGPADFAALIRQSSFWNLDIYEIVSWNVKKQKYKKKKISSLLSPPEWFL